MLWNRFRILGEVQEELMKMGRKNSRLAVSTLLLLLASQDFELGLTSRREIPETLVVARIEDRDCGVASCGWQMY
jgi:hypothetical protein